MPRVKRKARHRRRTPDDYFIDGWIFLLCGWRKPKGDIERGRAKALGMETHEQVREAWEVCRDKLMELRAANGHEKPW